MGPKGNNLQITLLPLLRRGARENEDEARQCLENQKGKVSVWLHLHFSPSQAYVSPGSNILNIITTPAQRKEKSLGRGVWVMMECWT